ncbi:hypothetical protein PO124_18495 [Bacillus licheniformis]|nr:hypothetical protein [Bacillus licheniformis]
MVHIMLSATIRGGRGRSIPPFGNWGTGRKSAPLTSLMKTDVSSSKVMIFSPLSCSCLKMIIDALLSVCYI